MKNKFSIIVFFLVFSLTSGHMVYGTTIGTNIDISNNLTVGGNVGIGDSSPSSKLVIKSNDYRDFISLDRTGDASVDQIWEISPSTDGSSPSGSLRFISGGSVITSFLSSGNVGIGINVPTYKLDVSGTFRATGNSYIGGNLGLGKTPSYKLDVEGAVNVSTVNAAVGTHAVTVDYVSTALDNFEATIDPSKWTTSGNNIYSSNTGNVGIGTSNPSYPLEVNGDVSADAFLYNSDIRFKNNISPIADSLSKITNLNGISYNLKDNNYRSVGLSAQEVQKNIPDAVRKDDNGNLSIDPSALIANLVEAIKEQQNQIEKQGSRIDELEKQLKLK